MIGYFLSFIRGKTGNKVELIKASDVTSSTQPIKNLASLVANQWSRGNFYRRWIASVWLKLFKLLFIPSLPEKKMLRAIILREILKVVFHSWMETHANWEQNGLMNWLHVPDHTRFPRATSKECNTVLLLLSFFSYLKCQAKIFF